MECPICYETINHECSLNCNHSLCKKCLYDWLLKGKLSCPYCRSYMNLFTYKGYVYEIKNIKK